MQSESPASTSSSGSSSNSVTLQRDPSDLTNSMYGSDIGSPASSTGTNSAAVKTNDATNNSHDHPSGIVAGPAGAQLKRPAASTSAQHRSKVARTAPSDRQHVDLANYSTQQLIHLLALALQHICQSNDVLRQQTASASHATPSAPGKTSSSPVTTPFLSPLATISGIASDAREDYFDRGTVHARTLTQSQPQQSSILNEEWSAARDILRSLERPLDPQFTASKTVYDSRNPTLCYHARNIPGIGIEQYLLRILKYCPTTNEVFIAMLVYFDRMARFFKHKHHERPQNVNVSHGQTPEGDQHTEPTPDGSIFVIDSFNIHRLLIAGITVASKFFSDVFYTNSRYAKVGGLPLNELNALELQFLLLNDFGLPISVDEMQLYADWLVYHWGTTVGSASRSDRPTQPVKLPVFDHPPSRDATPLGAFATQEDPFVRIQRDREGSESGSSMSGSSTATISASRGVQSDHAMEVDV